MDEVVGNSGTIPAPPPNPDYVPPRAKVRLPQPLAKRPTTRPTAEECGATAKPVVGHGFLISAVSRYNIVT